MLTLHTLSRSNVLKIKTTTSESFALICHQSSVLFWNICAICGNEWLILTKFSVEFINFILLNHHNCICQLIKLQLTIMVASKSAWITVHHNNGPTVEALASFLVKLHVSNILRGESQYGFVTCLLHFCFVYYMSLLHNCAYLD